VVTPKFSLVSTILNEEQKLRATISDIEKQSIIPCEVIVVDAGSTDGTSEMLYDWKAKTTIPVKVLVKEGCNVAEGRNLAIKEAKHPLIVSTDFGCRFHREWLASLVTPFTDEKVEVVGGNFTAFQEKERSVAGQSDYVLSNGYQLKMDDEFSVSSRSIAYKKCVWEEIGGYPEWLTLAADDTIFWRLIKQKGYNYKLVDKPYVYWMRHNTYRGFHKEAQRYGKGDGESGINLRTYISHLVETGCRYTLPLTGIMVAVNPYFVPVMAIQLFGLRSYVHAFKKWLTFRSKHYNLKVLLACFKMVEYTRWGYMKGYTAGLLNRNEEQKKAAKKLQTVIS